MGKWLAMTAELVPLQPLQYILRPVPAADIGQRGEVAWLPLGKLRIDPRYQRDILDNGKTNIRKIIEGFNWRKFGVVVVGRRPGGIFAIIDGQHRAVAALMHGGIPDVPCLILDGGLQVEAATFSAINGAVTRISPLQSFHADVAAGNEMAVALVDFCAVHGVTIVRRPKIDFKAGETMALALLRRTFEKDKSVLQAALQLLRGMEPEMGLGSDHLRGTILALQKLEVMPDDPAQLGATLAAGGGTAQNLMQAAWTRKATRGGPSFQNFAAVLVDKIRAALRTTPGNLKRMMAGR
jgi:hypothetical protein